MPLTNIVETYRWGYIPLNFFAPDERFGTPNDLRKLVKACHERGIAVIMDVVYNHISGRFGYNVIYNQIGVENPIVGTFGKSFGGLPDVDYSKQFAREFIFSVNRYYLDEFGVDGFRYDFTPGYFDGVHMGNVGLSHLLWSTREYAKSIGRPNIIQCIEHLENNPVEVFNKTYANDSQKAALTKASYDFWTLMPAATSCNLKARETTYLNLRLCTSKPTTTVGS